MTRTLVISDLHLGGGSASDVLRRPGPRAALIDALEDIDRLVLLGDVIELRHGPRRDALAVAQPFFEDLGRSLAGREIVILAGNHDHSLVESWLRAREERPAYEPLGLEQRFSAEEASPMAATLASWAKPAHVSVAYPGLWLRPDVYAMHGHYVNCHMTVPMLERLGIGMTARMLHRPTDALATVDDYEAVITPVFAWIDAASRQAPTGAVLNGESTVRVWSALAAGRGNGRRRIDLRKLALAGAFPLAVAALNKAGIGPFNTDISVTELRRAGLRAMGEVAARLGLGDAHVIFGHTHRAGPLAGDVQAEWRGPSGAHLINSGCWTYDSYFLAGRPGQSPYWPGGSVLVEDHGPPLVRKLLDQSTHVELAHVSA